MELTLFLFFLSGQSTYQCIFPQRQGEGGSFVGPVFCLGEEDLSSRRDEGLKTDWLMLLTELCFGVNGDRPADGV
jgi:hypothetical protein